MQGVEGAGALMLVDSMITIQGLEHTLEQIRAVNKLNVNFNSDMSATEKITAWQGLLALVVKTNKKTRVKG